jgi:hypothetical protein
LKKNPTWKRMRGWGWGSRGFNRWKWERTHYNIMLGNTLRTKEKWKEILPPPLLPKFKRNKSKAPWVHAWASHWLYEISIPKRVCHHLEPEWEMRRTGWGGSTGCIMHQVHTRSFSFLWKFSQCFCILW